MRNWLGQELGVGDVVYRGARDGNSSTFKVGTIIYIKDEKAPRVKWRYEDGGVWFNIAPDDPESLRPRKHFNVSSPRVIKDSQGSPTRDSLVRIDRSVLVYLDIRSTAVMAAYAAHSEINFQSADEVEDWIKIYAPYGAGKEE